MLLYMGLRPRHVIGAYEDLGMEIIAAGYEFAHNDDYDRTLPDLKEGTLLFDDASSYELEAFVKALKPDLIGSGSKRNISSRKWGAVPPDALRTIPAPITAMTASPSLPAIWI